MATHTASDLITRVRRRGDFENSEFVTDAELTDFLNQGLAELWDILISTFEHYGVDSDTTYALPGSGTFALPADFYKLIGVDFAPSSGTTTSRVRPYSFQHRNKYSNPVFKGAGVDLLEYQIVGDNMKFIPDDRPTGTVTLHYITTAPQLGANVTGIITGHEEYAVWYAVMLAKNKEESDIEFEISNIERLRERIQQAASRRDAGETTSIVDVGIGTELYHDLFYPG